MSVIGSNILAGASGQAGYNLTKSLRFRSSASAYLNRTLTTPTNNLKWTWSAWVKRGTLGTNILFNAGDGSSNNFGAMQFTTGNVIQFSQINGGSYNVQVTTNAVFRDPSAWYHVVLVYDSPNATSTDRVQIYVNGTRQSVTYVTGPFAQNTSSKINSALTHYISKLDYASLYFDGYLAEVNFIDGQTLTPYSFGETSTTTGVWIPKKYSGSYGTNGFYLPFTNTASTSTLGTDFSGNSNTWTVNNISLTSGSTYDSMTDVPTLTSATTANYCVLNPLLVSTASFVNGNLDGSISSGTASAVFAGTVSIPTTGKYYFEYTFNTASGDVHAVGIVQTSLLTKGTMSTDSNAEYATSVIYRGNGVIYKNTSSQGTYTAISSGDIIGVAVDVAAGTCGLYRNGSLILSVTSITSTDYSPFACKNPTGGSFSASFTFNAGQRPFAYTPPSGFVELNTYNLPTPTIGATASSQANKYFNTVLYTGTGSTPNSVTGVGFQPDFLWIKSRSDAYSHLLANAITTANNTLQSDGTAAEQTYGCINSFNSDGFTVDTDGTIGANNSGSTFVAWNWKANGSGSSNTAGSITSTVSASTTAGFSVVTYTSPNSPSNQTVGHGLGVKPSMIIVKNRDSAFNWDIYHSSLGYNSSLIFTTAGTRSGAFGAEPTSTVFTTTNTYTHNGTDKYVAYCFAPVAGYSAFGSYTGNGSTDGPFIFTGFRPRFIMIKASSFSTASTVWTLFDTSRSPYNASVNELYANLSSAEGVDSSGIDILSNGFKPRRNSDYANSNGQTYIYMAFAENPFKYANAR